MPRLQTLILKFDTDHLAGFLIRGCEQSTYTTDLILGTQPKVVNWEKLALTLLLNFVLNIYWLVD